MPPLAIGVKRPPWARGCASRRRQAGVLSIGLAGGRCHTSSTSIAWHEYPIGAADGVEPYFKKWSGPAGGEQPLRPSVAAPIWGVAPSGAPAGTKRGRGLMAESSLLVPCLALGRPRTSRRHGPASLPQREPPDPQTTRGRAHSQRHLCERRAALRGLHSRRASHETSRTRTLVSLLGAAPYTQMLRTTSRGVLLLLTASSSSSSSPLSAFSFICKHMFVDVVIFLCQLIDLLKRKPGAEMQPKLPHGH